MDGPAGRVWRDEWVSRGDPLDDHCEPRDPWPDESPGLILDQRSPSRNNYLGCVEIFAEKGPGRCWYGQFQQRITVKEGGVIGRIDVRTGGSRGRNLYWTTIGVGVTLTRPWAGSQDDFNNERTYSTEIESNGDQFHWDEVDLSHLGWVVAPGDEITLHFTPLSERVCMGYDNTCRHKHYSGGEMHWQGEVWGCEPTYTDISFRLWMIENGPTDDD